MYLGVVGMNLSSQLGRTIESGFAEVAPTQVQCESIEAALSYVACITKLFSLYLGLPLRYPIKLLGSRSVVMTPSSSRLVSSSVQSREWASSHQELPLFFQGSGRFAKKRLALGFCLLAKDIYQLLASHGVKSIELGALLENLDALVAASRSGITNFPCRS